MRIIETGHPTVTALAFSPDGMTLATAGPGHDILLWELGGTGPERLTGAAGGVQTLAFSPDGATLASAGTPEMVVLGDLAAGRGSRSLTPKLPAGVPVCALAWMHNGNLLAAGTGDRINGARAGHLLVWDLAKPDTPVKRVPEPHGVWAVAATP